MLFQAISMSMKFIAWYKTFYAIASTYLLGITRHQFDLIYSKSQIWKHSVSKFWISFGLRQKTDRNELPKVFYA